MSRYILALDQGTTSSRAIVFDRDARPVAVAQQEFPQILPAPGVVEHDPEAIWSSQLAVAREALQRAGATSADLAAIGITNQRETTILWDRATGRPVANAIVWQSRVSAPECDRLKAAGLEPLFREKTGLVLDAYFSGTKIKHLLDADASLRRRAEAGEVLFGTVDTFLIWRLTGGKRHVTDVSNASRTLLLNIHTLEWDDELLGLLDIPRRMLPEVCSSSEVGWLDPRRCGWRSARLDWRMRGGSAGGDVWAGMFSAGRGEEHLWHWLFSALEHRRSAGRVAAWLADDRRLASWRRNNLLSRRVGVRRGCGRAMELARRIGIDSRIGRRGTAACGERARYGWRRVRAGACRAGAAPWHCRIANMPARAIFCSLTHGGTTAAHLARATVESMAFQSCDLLRAIEQDAGAKLSELKVDGGASRSDALLQFQADLLDTPVVRPVVTETTALGAAYLAGLAVGFWHDLADVAKHWANDRRFNPAMPSAERDKLYGQWQRAVERTKDWATPRD